MVRLVILSSISVFLLIKCVFTYDNSLVVKTHNGDLLGKHMTSRSRRVFSAFLGIPYASPPTGKLRFLPPTSMYAWEGVRNATQEGDQCLQRGIMGNHRVKGSEDCLHLNIFTHKPHRNQSHAVMVFIHGGSFHIGSSSVDFYGPEYLMDRDIVLVVLQYRLGVFGFLSTEYDIIAGNMGLKDQVKALQWIKENIEVFGGDPQKVTIFGESAGGSSVHFHMQSPLSENLFHRGISESGTALSGFAFAPQGTCRNITLRLASSLNCSIDNNTNVSFLECLQAKTMMEIFNAYTNLEDTEFNFNKLGSLLRPVVEVNSDHAFITRNPKLTSTNKPWMVGVNANEGIYTISNRNLNSTLTNVKEKFHSFSLRTLYFEGFYKNSEPAYEFYFKNTSSTEDIIDSLERLISDCWFNWPTEQAIQSHKGPLHYYLFNHSGEHSFTEVFRCPKKGVSHMDELIMLFRQKNIFPNMSESDMNISKLIIDFWVNFAVTGNPTPDYISKNPQNQNLLDFSWEATKASYPSYLHIQTSNLSMEKRLFSDRMTFWRQFSAENSL